MTSKPRVLCVLSMLLVVPLAGVPASSEGHRLMDAPGRRILTITPEKGAYSSPALAVNPNRAEQVVVAFQPAARSSYSFDGGQNWETEQRTTGPAQYRSFGDTSVVYDRNGYAIMCFTALDGAGPFKYWGHNPKRNGVLIRRSPDGGKTWEPRTIPVVEHPDGPGIPFEDLPSIIADVQPHSRHTGNLYVAWSQDRLQDSLILLSRSVDGGLTWSKAVRLSDKPGGPRDDNGTVEGVRGAVGPDGTVHVVWSDAGHLVYTVSHDGGKTFSRNKWLVEAGPFHFQAFNLSEANGYPQIGMMTGKGSARPSLYVTWSDFRNGDVDIFCISSQDGGAHWSAPVRVNDDELHNNADQLFQWLAVDPVSGAVNVMFYDRRRDPANRSADVVLARSTDGGRSFRNYLFSERSFDPMGGRLGEYTAVTAFGGKVYGSWIEILPPAAAGSGEGNDRSRPAAVIRLGMTDFGR